MYDIFYIATTKTNEYLKLVNRFPTIKLVDSFDKASTACLTSFFWVVWDDIIIENDFNFDYEPDIGSQEYIHVFLNGTTYDGVSLFPKDTKVTTRELTHRFFVNKKELNIVASKPKPFDIFHIEKYEDYLLAIDQTTTGMFWMINANIDPYFDVLNNFYISHHDSYSRNQNHAFLNDTGEEKLPNGVFLLSKSNTVSKKEIDFKHIVDVDNTQIIASKKVKYDIFVVDSYEEYLEAYNTSKTEMFWGISNNIQIKDTFDFSLYFGFDNFYDRHENHAFIHREPDNDFYNGVFLFSKRKQVSKNEIQFRHLVNRKEWPIVASEPAKYDIFHVKTYNDYLNALKNSKTEMFWIIPDNVKNYENFDFSLYFNYSKTYERTHHHAFLNGDYYDGIFLCSKHSIITKREFDYGFVANKVETGIKASDPKTFDVVFISYNESNADENYKKLLLKVPNAKRIHGIKGIHNAHREAAKLVSTNMFWIVDGDAEVCDDFNFDYQVPKWDFTTVFVWRSVNSVNDLVYGYGGVKLFPTQLTLDMDTNTTDMTTSISKNFKPMNQISNVTVFNTDPFSTWKSAFRECVKLSSKIIDRQKNTETENRLLVWKTTGLDKPHGIYSVKGAEMGEEFGIKFKEDKEQLKKINDFDWLYEVFNDTFK